MASSLAREMAEQEKIARAQQDKQEAIASPVERSGVHETHALHSPKDGRTERKRIATARWLAIPTSAPLRDSGN